MDQTQATTSLLIHSQETSKFSFQKTISQNYDLILCSSASTNQIHVTKLVLHWQVFNDTSTNNKLLFIFDGACALNL